jgi:hypothetical protein
VTLQSTTKCVFIEFSSRSSWRRDESFGLETS